MTGRNLTDWATLTFCRLGICGLSPVMPGTCGTLFAMLIAPCTFLCLGPWSRAVCLCTLFVLGSLAATRTEAVLGKKDPGEVVIDELLGYWTAIAPLANPSWTELIAAFILFRVFDMLKPWPINASEYWLPNGWGVMIDDVIGGLAALAATGLLLLIGIL